MEYHPLKYRLKQAIPILVVLLLVGALLFFRHRLFPGLYNKKSQATTQSATAASGAKKEAHLSAEEEKRLQMQAAEIIKTRNPSGCDEIPNDEYQNVCKNNIYMNKAEAEKDSSYCRQLDSKLMSVADCEREILFPEAIEKGDVSVCNQASSDEVRSLCQKNYISNMPLRKNDASICDMATDDKEKQNCYDSYNFYSNFLKDPLSFDCHKFNDAGLASNCLKYQDNKKAGQEDACAGIDSPYFSPLCARK